MADLEEDTACGLAKRLKEGTQAAHQAAEKAVFVHEFIKGNIAKESYCQFLVNLKVVYEALEQELDKHWENEVLEPLYFPEELRRSATLDADIRFFCGDAKYEPFDVTRRYVARLHEIGDTHPELLISHAYTRYLGDLSGGQFLKRALSRAFKLDKLNGEGAQFYIFKHIKDVKAFKNMYRARLDSLPVSDELAESMVAEANRAFEMNMDLFMQLDVPNKENRKPTLSSDVPTPSAKSCNSACAGCPFAALISPGTAVPKGHPKLPIQFEEKISKPASPDCPLGSKSNNCPLRQLGDKAPRVALCVVPIAFTVLQAASLLAPLGIVA